MYEKIQYFTVIRYEHTHKYIAIVIRAYQYQKVMANDIYAYMHTGMSTRVYITQFGYPQVQIHISLITHMDTRARVMLHIHKKSQCYIYCMNVCACNFKTLFKYCICSAKVWSYTPYRRSPLAYIPLMHNQSVYYSITCTYMRHIISSSKSTVYNTYIHTMCVRTYVRTYVRANTRTYLPTYVT